MKDEPTILGDRETVEFLSADPQLLAIADAVRATQREERRAWTRPRLLVPAAAVSAVAALCAVLLTGALGGHPASTADPYPAINLSYLPSILRERPVPVTAVCPIHDCQLFGYPMPDLFDYAITRTDGAISSIGVTIHGTRVDSTAQLEVHMEGTGPSGTRRVVFSKRVSLNPIPSPPPGAVALSEWSGSLSPSGWDGGCQDATYWFSLRITNAGGGITEIQPPSFNCQGAAVGPTGSSGPTGAVGATRG